MSGESYPSGILQQSALHTPMALAQRLRGLSDRAISWWFITPTILLLLAINIFPLIWTIYLSFTNFDLLQDPQFIGTANYERILTNDVKFWHSMRVTFAYVIMAVPLKLFDELNFGWRYGSIFTSAISVVFFYSFFRTFLMRWVALTAAFLIAASHYFMSFSRIGYNNTQALLAMGVTLAAAAWASAPRTPWCS